MTRGLRTFFLALAGLLAIYAVLFACWLRAMGTSPFAAKSLWMAVLGIFLFVVTASCFRASLQFKIFVALVWLIVVEGLLQIASWLGVLPGVNTKVKVPYGRVFWTAEGRSNDIRNRFGWHFPEFDLTAKHRIAVIGDSFVEAVEVGRSRNFAAELQTEVKKRAPDWSVLALGTHGTCCAHHLDVLNYAQRHFAPQEAIVAVYIGNDVTESSPVFNYMPAQSFIYYDLDRNGRIELNPASAAARENFITGMEVCHRTLWMHLPVIANSHCMLLQIPLSVRSTLEILRRQRENVARSPGNAEFAKVGLNPAIDAMEPTPETEHAFAVMFAELGRLKELCDGYAIKLRVVTIPCFPEKFYQTQSGRDWTMRIGDFDFLGPEQRVAQFASEHGISHLELGALMRARRLDVAEIRALYLSNGIGHFSEKGHRFCADAIFSAFYDDVVPQPQVDKR